jgi:hypothetical protein
MKTKAIRGEVARELAVVDDEHAEVTVNSGDEPMNNLAHALAHAWPVWTHHDDPFYVCGDDTFDLLYGRIREEDHEEFIAEVFASLAAHGIRVEPDLDRVWPKEAEVYGCPDGLPMPPLPVPKTYEPGTLLATIGGGEKAAKYWRGFLADRGYPGWRVEDDGTMLYCAEHDEVLELDGECPEGCGSPLIRPFDQHPIRVDAAYLYGEQEPALVFDEKTRRWVVRKVEAVLDADEVRG